jgi:hypothetical protein
MGDRRLNIATKYQIKHRAIAAEQTPIELLKEATTDIEKGRYKLYSNYSYPWKDNSENFKKDYLKNFD